MWPSSSVHRYRAPPPRLTNSDSRRLVVGGGRDGFYTAALFRKTARGIRNARLLFYADKGHVGVLSHDPARREIVRFLAGDLTARQADTGDAGPVPDATQVPGRGGAGHRGGEGT